MTEESWITSVGILDKFLESGISLRSRKTWSECDAYYWFYRGVAARVMTRSRAELFNGISCDNGHVPNPLSNMPSVAIGHWKWAD